MEQKKSALKEIASIFFRMGCVAFGGPAAHIAMMEEQVVRKRKWMSHEHFLDLVGATNLIPGPNSTEMTMHCGHERGGWKGLLIAGGTFIFPAVVITMILAYFYSEYGELPEIKPFIYGIKPAVIAIILIAVYNLGKKAFKSTQLWFLGVFTLVMCFSGVNEIASLFICGFIGLIVNYRQNSLNSFIPMGFFSFGLKGIATSKIFLSFLKVGAILYGSGYVLFAFLETELVSNGLLTREVLIDAIAVGQFTPGPVLTTATFIGWQMNGFVGAIAATVGIFLPSFLFVALLNPLIPKLRKSKHMSSFLDAVNVGAVAIIFYVCYQMGKEAITDWRTIVIALSSLAALYFWKKMNSAFVVIGGSLLGYVLWQL
jgi:chromate transporter